MTEADGSKSEVMGLWKLPYLAEENADEDPEIQFSTASEGGAMQRAKAALQISGKPVSIDTDPSLYPVSHRPLAGGSFRKLFFS
jgi:hypothetical protein